MNSGKVRIYELSKELNLENKDILAICERENISVKSHSSTITDAEAERIRSAAEKQIASHPSPTKTHQGHSHQGSDAKGRVTPPVQKKQQILEIRKPIIRHSPVPPEPPTPPSYNAAQPRAVSPPIQPSTKLVVQASRPVRSLTDNVEEDSKVSSELLIAETGEEIQEEAIAVEPMPTKAEAVEVAEIPNLPEELEVGVDEVDQSVSQPELVTPPPRPTAPVSVPMSTLKPDLSNRPNRPVLKRSQPNEANQRKSAPERLNTSPASDDRSGKGEFAEAVPSSRSAPSGKHGESSKSPERPTPRPQTIVELRRPSRPGASDAATKSPGRGDGREGVTEPILKLNRPQQPMPSGVGAPVPASGDGLQLHRPAPPRAKKGKGWQEEEEDVQEFPEKGASKAGTKSKRKTQLTLDDDDDLENLLDEDRDLEDTPIQVSLSLVRPTKPKAARPAQARPAATPSPKAKRSSTRRDRKEEQKIEKPEKITLMGGLTVQELAAMLIVPETEIIKSLFFKGIAANITQTLDIPTATMVAQEFGIAVETGERAAEARKVTEMLDAADLENLQRRPPVVTIMGHVDHGKTTLLDSIRKTKVAQGEAGGITQHIGAYHVDVEHEGQMQQVVFLDTPGHEAFTAMRARGARVTDIAILVIAADDGVRPQTIEAIRHAQAAEVPIVVAINKVDKEEAQPDRVKQELTEFGLVPEEWGGETIMVPVSALTGDNLDTLLEMLLLVAEVEDLYANPDRAAKGTVIEAHLDKAKGPVATLLIQNGSLQVGDILVAGSVLGKVRAMVDDRGQRVKEASPSFAVEVLGLGDVPAAGDEFEVFVDEKEARAIATARADEQRQTRLMQAMGSRRVSLNTLSARAQEGELKELNLVLKADVQGSVEAILNALKQLPQNEVQVRVLYAAPGEITETDVDLAAASDAVIIGFNTTLAPGARQSADRVGVDVRDYTIIYNLLDDIQAAMEGLLEPEMVEEPLGQIEVRAVFPVGRGSVAGCYVQNGKVLRNCKLRVRRGNTVIHEGNLDSLKRMKEDVREVNAGYECGIGLDNFNAWEIGDIIETYRMVAKRRTLTPAK